MTSETNLHARQRTLGFVVLALAVVTLSTSFYSIREDQAQRACLEDTVSDLGESLQVRAMLSERDSKAKTAVILAASKAQSREDYGRAFEEFEQEQDKIDQLRADNPVPPFPEGKCG